MADAAGTTENIKLGPGWLWVAPIDTTAPASASAALDAAWWCLGYTEDGTTVDIEYTAEGVEVAEELDPVDYVNTARAVRYNVSLAEVTRKRMALALALGAEYVDSAAVLDLPDGDAVQVGCAVLWDSTAAHEGNDQNIRWYTPKVLPTGTISIPRQKAPNKSLLPLVLNAIKVTGSPITRIFPNASGLV